MARPTEHSLEKHNELIRRGMLRAEQLEGKLARLIEPILVHAGREAARNFAARATNHLAADARLRDRQALASVRPSEVAGFLASLSLCAGAGDVKATTTMIAVKPRPIEAEALSQDGGMPAEDLHVTLVFLGELEGDLAPVLDAIRSVAGTHAPLTGKIAGQGQFLDDQGEPVVDILLPDVPGLVELRVAITNALVQAGIAYSRDHGFLAHTTVTWEPTGEAFDVAGAELHFDEVLVVRGDEEMHSLPLTGSPPLTAAGQPAWSPPAANEVLNVDPLVQSLRTKTDPVRLAVINNVGKSTVESAGVAWDVTNPYVVDVLEHTGSQIVNIAQTTQANVMNTIAASYDQGLSIPDTAKVIQAGMKEASAARATLIARTEMTGTVNGGSLAATKMVADAFASDGGTGGGFSKVWMTAPGAPYPRHETYEGLDGQTTTLEGLFTVGEDQLQYPGDPVGTPEEVCNCRCALSYVNRAGDEVASADADNAGVMPDLGDGGAVQGDILVTNGEADVMFDQSYKSWGSKLTDEHRDALWAYRTGNGYQEVNKALRTGETLDKTMLTVDPTNKELVGGTYTPTRDSINMADAVKAIDHAIDSSPGLPAASQTHVFRGIGDVADLFGKEGPVIGQTITDRTYVSTTTDRETAANFAIHRAPIDWEAADPNVALLDIQLPAGQKAVWMQKVSPSFGGTEHELLLPRDMRFEVMRIEDQPLFLDDQEGVQAKVVTLRPVVEPTPAQVVSPTSTVRDPLRPFKDFNDNVLGKEIWRARDGMKKLLAKDTLTVREQERFANHKARLQGLLSERAIRTGKAAPEELAVEQSKAAVQSTNPNIAALQEAYNARPSDLTMGTPDLARLKATGAAFDQEMTKRLQESGRTYAVAADRRQVAMEILSEVRAVGKANPAKFAFKTTQRSEAARLIQGYVEKATQFYPRDWIEKASEKQVVYKSSARGYFNDNGLKRGTSEIGFGATSATEGMRVATHELGHFMESVVPGIREAESKFYAERVGNERLSHYRGRPNEFVRTDEFPAEYMGRDYSANDIDDNYLPDKHEFYEILTVGMESLFNDSGLAASRIWQDEDLVHFLLGLLVSV